MSLAVTRMNAHKKVLRWYLVLLAILWTNEYTLPLAALLVIVPLAAMLILMAAFVYASFFVGMALVALFVIVVVLAVLKGLLDLTREGVRVVLRKPLPGLGPCKHPKLLPRWDRFE